MRPYYLFIFRQKDLDSYRKEFDRVYDSMNKGKTPVYNELRSCKTDLAESVPYGVILGIFSIIAAILISKLNLNETVMVALVLCINRFCNSIANCLFTVIKHWLRVKLCERLGIEPNERNIAVMESLEYQSV